MGDLRDEQIILDINTTIEWLRKNPRVTGDRIGIVGFCAGGRITYLAASACNGLSAAVNFYGGGAMRALGDDPSPFDRTANIMCPVMGNFGELDQNPSPDEVRQTEAEFKKHGKTYDFKIYPGAGHGFFCDERSDYREEAAGDAWNRTLEWFQRYLTPVAASA
jgi:carboxymethylenebutenolidase